MHLMQCLNVRSMITFTCYATSGQAKQVEIATNCLVLCCIVLMFRQEVYRVGVGLMTADG